MKLECKPQTRDFIASLLDPNPASRLAGTIIRDHAFFQGLNWDDVYRKKIAPPWKPWCDDSDDEDVSNFPSDLTDFTPPTASQIGFPMSYNDSPLEGFSYTGGASFMAQGRSMSLRGSIDDDLPDRAGDRNSPGDRMMGTPRGLVIGRGKGGGGTTPREDDDAVFGMSL